MRRRAEFGSRSQGSAGTMVHFLLAPMPSVGKQVHQRQKKQRQHHQRTQNMRLGIAHEQCCGKYQEDNKNNTCRRPQNRSGRLIGITFRVHADEVLCLSTSITRCAGCPIDSDQFHIGRGRRSWFEKPVGYPVDDRCVAWSRNLMKASDAAKRGTAAGPATAVIDD
jgi:hypothetical protein